MLLMHPTRRMPRADTEKPAPKIAIDVGFDEGIQALSALESAAYRLIGTATCEIEKVGNRIVCHLALSNGQANGGAVTDADALRVRFLDIVTDENLRARVSARTDGVRNVILALAFGSLAASQGDN